ncbi:MAG: SAM-dependent methyltransferase [Kofleriaceae bacterium]
MADFAFATCLPGMEPAVKREVARTRPDLRFAFSRPGLLTFKAPGPLAPEDTPGSVFARVWGRSVGAAGDLVTAKAQLANVRADRVHVFARDPEADYALLVPWAQLAAPTEVHDGDASIGDDAREGELVADVIVPPTADEPVWIGAHRHEATRGGSPGGVRAVRVPDTAPSRAYAKIEEAIAWAQLPVAAGQVALEIGAAPGGAVMALAQRGLEVIAVDTGALADNVRAMPGVVHLDKKVGALRWEELPANIAWLLVDVNLAPQVALHEIARLMPFLKKSLVGAVITLKMNDWQFVDELPDLARRIREMGLPDVRMRHLPSNRREICVVARPR